MLRRAFADFVSSRYRLTVEAFLHLRVLENCEIFNNVMVIQSHPGLTVAQIVMYILKKYNYTRRVNA